MRGDMESQVAEASCFFDKHGSNTVTLATPFIVFGVSLLQFPSLSCILERMRRAPAKNQTKNHPRFLLNDLPWKRDKDVTAISANPSTVPV